VWREPEVVPVRRSPCRTSALLQEFRRRSGDHNTGGSTRRPLVTAYREEALRVAAFLQQAGSAKVKAVRETTGVAKAGSILHDDYYGWFERVRLGVYRLTPTGEQGLTIYADVVPSSR